MHGTTAVVVLSCFALTGDGLPRGPGLPDEDEFTRKSKWNFSNTHTGRRDFEVIFMFIMTCLGQWSPPRSKTQFLACVIKMSVFGCIFIFITRQSKIIFINMHSEGSLRLFSCSLCLVLAWSPPRSKTQFLACVIKMTCVWLHFYFDDKKVIRKNCNYRTERILMLSWNKRASSAVWR